MKKYVVEIGYDYYEVPSDKLAALMDLSLVLTRLEYLDYKNYVPHKDQNLFVNRVELADIRERDSTPVEEPGI